MKYEKKYMHLMHNLIDLHYERDSFTSDISFVMFLFFKRMLFIFLVKDVFSIYSLSQRRNGRWILHRRNRSLA